ncbi:MAG: substrate-binding domain-containing protein, partial [Oscillospiraceae bacterium]|nr:substrate-binding domain-containing protein [Oscillospiraceae bacterium]
DVILTTDPQGNTAAWYTVLYLTAEEVEQVRAMNLRAGFELINASEWDMANLIGFTEAADFLNIEIAAQAIANLDPIQQRENMEQFLAMNLDIVTCQPQDLDIAAATFDPLVDAGTILTFMSNVPTGYTAGVEYVAAITSALVEKGIDAASMLADAMGGQGDVIAITLSAVNFVCNTRDQAFLDTLAERYPGINVVEIGGFQTPAEAGTVTAGLLTRFPNVTGIYVSYSHPALDVLEAVRGLGRDDVKIVTMDLDSTIALDMAMGGNVVGIVVDLPFIMGFGRALLAAYGALDKEAPGFLASPSFKVDSSNLLEAYRLSLGIEAPQEVQDALSR